MTPPRPSLPSAGLNAGGLIDLTEGSYGNTSQNKSLTLSKFIFSIKIVVNYLIAKPLQQR